MGIMMGWNGSKLHIDGANQRLTLLDADGRRLTGYAVSTAENGFGEQKNSFQTPRGLHYVRARIGEGCPSGAVFVGRRWTGELYTPTLGAAHPGRDWILTRILWLCGLEPGRNRGGAVDTFQRYIYIHGTPELDRLGTPASHGCIRMDSRDLLDLYAQVPVGTPVRIEP